MSQGNSKSKRKSKSVRNNGGIPATGIDGAHASAGGSVNDADDAVTRPGGAQAGAVAPSLIIDSWYASAIADGHRHDPAPPQRVASLDQTLETHFPRLAQLALRSRLLRGVLWHFVSREVQRVVCPFAAPGLLSFLFFERVLGRGRPRVILVEFLRPRPVRARDRLKEALHTRICATLFPATIAGIQVMTSWEARHYADKYRLPDCLFTTIPFPMMLNPSALPAMPAIASDIVMASGRAACDWKTLFDAARGARWRLSVVCSHADRPLVERLNADNRATVLSEVSPEEHARLLGNAAVYVLALREQDASTGQVRLARAIEAGIPVVASDVRGLDGYLEDGITAIGVPPDDARALRHAIDRLIGDPAASRALRIRAYEAMRSRSLQDYVSRIKVLALKDA